MKKPLSHRAVVVTRTAVVAVLLAVSLVIFQVLVATGPVVPTVDPNEAPTRVNVFTAIPVKVSRQWTGYGTAEALDSANVPARVTATVTAIPPGVLEGAAVTKGQLLVELDDSDYANQLQIARQNLAGVQARLAELDTLEKWLTQRLQVETSDLELAQDELDRVKDLLKKNAANQKDVDAAQRAVLAVRRSRLLIEESLNGVGPRRDQLLAEKAGLRSSADIAQKNLDRCSISSPIDGVIQFVDVEVGENLTLGQRVARVVNLERVQIPLSLAANARSHIRIGDTALLTSTADPGLSWAGTVVRIAPEDDPATRTFAAYVEVTPEQTASPIGQAPRARLAPGVFVSGLVVEHDAVPRLVVPRRSIRTERVMLVRDGLIHSSRVTKAYAIEGTLPALGLPDRQWTVLDGGINEGDLVVLNPTRTLSDGQKVEPVELDRDAPAESETAGVGSIPQGQPGRGDSL
jgi:RND family efflux transporter MFP subunit